MLLDSALRQPGCGESVAHGRRGGLVVGHVVMVHPSTDSSGQVGAARRDEQPSRSLRVPRRTYGLGGPVPTRPSRSIGPRCGAPGTALRPLATMRGATPPPDGRHGERLPALSAASTDRLRALGPPPRLRRTGWLERGRDASGPGPSHIHMRTLTTCRSARRTRSVPVTSSRSTCSVSTRQIGSTPNRWMAHEIPHLATGASSGAEQAMVVGGEHGLSPAAHAELACRSIRGGSSRCSPTL